MTDAISPPALPVETAPRDGTMLRLLVDYTGIDEWTPLEDATTAWTVGFNNLRDTDEDVWQVVGWNWCQDCFTPGHDRVVGWLPFHRGKWTHVLWLADCQRWSLGYGSPAILDGNRAFAPLPEKPAGCDEFFDWRSG